MEFNPFVFETKCHRSLNRHLCLIQCHLYPNLTDCEISCCMWKCMVFVTFILTSEEAQYWLAWWRSIWPHFLGRGASLTIGVLSSHEISDNVVNSQHGYSRPRDRRCHSSSHVLTCSDFSSWWRVASECDYVWMDTMLQIHSDIIVVYFRN